MNKTIQFLNTPLCISVCVHAIAVAIAAFVVVGSTHKHGDTITAEFVSAPQTEPRFTPRQLKVPALAQPTLTHVGKPDHIRTRPEVPRLPQSTPQFVIDPFSVSTVPQITPTAIGIAAGKAYEPDVPVRSLHRGSQAIQVPSKQIPRPERTSTPSIIASAEAAELPPVSTLPDEPIQNARFFRKVDPLYPESARLSHKQGLVVLEATIGTDGIARDIEIVKVVEISGLGCEEAAITALKASRFVPATRGKIAISQRLRIPYRFQFKD